MTRADLERLHEEGLEHEAALHVVEVVSYFNFVNRMADGLGVRLEEGWPHPLIGDPPGGRSSSRGAEDPE